MPSPTPRHWTLPRVLVRIVLFFTLFGPLLADLVIPGIAERHLHNPAWPPHAKFHDAQYIVMAALIGLVGIVVLWRRTGNPRGQFFVATALASVTWLGMFGALLFPGTAAQDPQYADGAELIGLDPQLFIALVMLLLLAAALVLERTHRPIPRPAAG